MKQPSLSASLAEIKPYLWPSRPGRGRDRQNARGVGFLLGPLGNGIYFKSAFDGAVSFAITLMLLPFFGLPHWLMSGLVGMIYGAVRVIIDSDLPGGKPELVTKADEPLFEGGPA